MVEIKWRKYFKKEQSSVSKAAGMLTWMRVYEIGGVTISSLSG